MEEMGTRDRGPLRGRNPFEVEVATFTENGESGAPRPNGAATAVQTRAWAPPAPVAVMPAIFPDDFAVKVFSSVAGPTLVAAIELERAKPPV